MISSAKLLKELAAYVPADAAEAVSLARVRELLSRADDPFTRANPDHLTGSAVVARPDGMAFLLVFHRRLDRWLQPGGHVEPEDASVFEAARREACEETGVSDFAAPLGARVLDVDVHRIPPRDERPGHIHHDVRFLFTTRALGAQGSADEVAAVRWFTFEQAKACADASLLRALRKANTLLGEPTETEA